MYLNFSKYRPKIPFSIERLVSTMSLFKNGPRCVTQKCAQNSTNSPPGSIDTDCYIECTFH